MALTLEWLHRFEAWHEELKQHFYRPLSAISFRGFATREQLQADQARTGAFQPMPPGTPWGLMWEYGWFLGELALPVAARGRRIVLRLDLNAECAVYIDGRLAGAVDREHRELTLSRNGVPDTRHEVLVEAYAGHGPTPCSVGPVPPGRLTVPEPPSTQRTVGESTYGIWEEDAYQLWLDVETLYSLRKSLDPESLRVAEIDRGLRDFTLLVDFELPLADRLATIRTCQDRLRPLLACTNGSTAPTMYACGHAHIDVAWLWPLAETGRKCVRTFATQLALLAEYPEYRFLQSQPHLYWMVKTRHPELYARIRQEVLEGRFIPDGGMWVEADTNLTGGESLIRQFLHGKRFFQDEFGLENELLWLPDVFGYSGALPQIMRGCGIKYFSTQKIFWTYHGGDPFPYNTFAWEGIDGSEVLTHLHNDYNSATDPATVITRWRERVQKDGFKTRLLPFGHGDGGGGPTRDHLEFLRRLEDLEGAPRTRMAAPAEFFHDLEAQGTPAARYVGELYFQAHRGTYTSQARTKKGNRKGEFALREAELWSVAAQALYGYALPAAALHEAWRSLLLQQFHDILPGSSIHRVYEETEAAHAKLTAEAQEIARAAAGGFTKTGKALSVFNSLSWDRRALVALPPGWRSAAAQTGDTLPSQVVEGVTHVEATVPSCGWTTLRPAEPVEITANLYAAPDRLENELLRLVLDGKGEIVSIYDKESGWELAAGPCNSLRMYRDAPSFSDAWDIDSQYELTPVDLPDAARIEVVAAGPLLSCLKITRRLHGSMMRQEVSLRRGSRRVEFKTAVDWRESHKLLKVAFPVNIHAHEAIHEIQFGHVRRPNHRSRPFDADRFEVSNHKWSALAEEGRGFAVLNDCKYGLNVLGRSINLSLLRAPLAPDMTADQGLQEFTYAFYPWNGPLLESGVVREAYELNTPVFALAGDAGERSLLRVDAPNVMIETVKPAEDGSPDIVVRLYEAMRTATRCRLLTTLPVLGAAETNMLERVTRELEGGQELELVFRPFEIKTVRLGMQRL